jgi:hypothetical protein
MFYSLMQIKTHNLMPSSDLTHYLNLFFNIASLADKSP